MTDKELRKLTRTELYELLLYFKNESDQLKEENEALKAELGMLRSMNNEIGEILDTVRESSEILRHIRVRTVNAKKNKAESE